MSRHSNIKPASSHPRIVRYDELVPCFDAFIDTRTPGSDQKENFTIIGPGVSENPDQHVHIVEPHGFNIGGARQPPGCVNSQHSHDTEEVFYVHSGTWSFMLGETGEDAKITLQPGDLISVPSLVFRGFENIGDDVGYLWAVLGGDDPGHVLWAPYVFDMAREYGLILVENGMLIDTSKGETVPEGKAVMPVTTQDQVKALKRLGHAELRQCCVTLDDQTVIYEHQGVRERKLIAPDAKISWPHGFILSEMTVTSNEQSEVEATDEAEVIFIQQGVLEIDMPSESWRLQTGDTATLPTGIDRLYRNSSDSPVKFIRVRGTR
ncbi:MAG: cupin domain-containing protein [Hyphomonadaceae bacterium]|nr:cupin domain-containing protein [Hyphomonadaceae bacterium]